jgi:flagellar basal-body rod protein FlgF
MQSGLYVALSGQIALERRMATIANNVANAGTVGYRAEEAKFETVLSRAPERPAAFAATDRSYLSERAGGFVKTDNPLDVAIRGSGFLSVQTPAGPVYTRDGRMQLLPTGELVSLNGHAILDAGGAPILLDPSTGPPEIARDGMITQKGRQVGAIGLFSLDLSGSYSRTENSGIVPKNPATPILSFTSDGFVQGFVEQSNVNAVTEMTRLIMVTRAFESAAAAIGDSESSIKNAIQTLGAGA